jgi:hypothetical protein
LGETSQKKTERLTSEADTSCAFLYVYGIIADSNPWIPEPKTTPAHTNSQKIRGIDFKFASFCNSGYQYLGFNMSGNLLFGDNRRLLVDIFSSAISFTIRKSTCPTHENCDGSCTGPIIAFPPSHSSEPRFRVSRVPNPRILPPDCVCRNAAWLADQQFESFHYAPIDLSCSMIRLLRVQPAYYREDVLECDLVDASLHEKPMYIALSYCWGRADPVNRILLNGKVISITENLYKALKSYRLASYTHDNVAIWVDTVCINQQDVEERMAQVSLMRNIYSQASSVRVDLGHVDLSWYPGYELLNKLLWVAHLEESFPIGGDYTSDSIIREYCLPGQSDAVWNTYRCLFGSAWFTRTWILQEIALSKDADVNYGIFSFKWQHLVLSFKLYQLLQLEQPGSHDNILLNEMRGMLYMTKIIAFCNYSLQPRSRYTWLETVRLAKDFHVTDARDKIFGVLGFVDEQPLEGLEPFRPDYTISIKSLYHRFGEHLSRLGMAQQMLSFSGLHRRGKISGLPTWAPDWMSEITERQQSLSMPICQIRIEPYRAGSIRQPPPSILAGSPGEEATFLILVGDCIDTISYITAASQADDQADVASMARMFLSWHDEVELLISHAIVENTANTIYQNLNEALAQTLLMNNLYTGENGILNSSPIVWPKETHRAALRSIQEIARGAGATKSKPPSMCEIETFKMQMNAALIGRKFAITEMGYMALVSDYAEVGDRIAIVLGARIPFVLRETANDIGDCRIQYLHKNTDSDAKIHFAKREDQPKIIMQVVGDCYVHEIMEGQALKFKHFTPQQLWLK